MSELHDYLVRRLTPGHATVDRWVELAQAMEEFWNTYFEPQIDAYERSRSVFTADDEDVERKLAELGIKFEVALPITPSSKAMAYSMRGYEIHRKDTQAVLESILQRDFKAAVLKWIPLKAVKSEPYGTRFLTPYQAAELGIPDSDLWQTSRGIAEVDISLAMSYGFGRLAIRQALERKMTELRPAHIVFDGTRFFALHFIPVEQPTFTAEMRLSKVGHTMDADPFSLIRFDDVELDIATLDQNQFNSHHEGTDKHFIDGSGHGFAQWRLDMGWPINGRWRYVPGVEADITSVLHNLAVDSTTGHSMAFQPTRIGVASGLALPVDKFIFDAGRTGEFGIEQGEVSETSHDVASRPEAAYNASASLATTVKISFLPTQTGLLNVQSQADHALDVDRAEIGGFNSASTRHGEARHHFVSGEYNPRDMPELDEIPLDFVPLDLRYP